MKKLGVWVTVQVLQEPSDSPVTGFPHLSPQIMRLSGTAPSPTLSSNQVTAGALESGGN